MAVSQMQKLSLILPKDDLDSLLLALQSEAKIQIYDLSEQNGRLPLRQIPCLNP